MRAIYFAATIGFLLFSGGCESPGTIGDDDTINDDDDVLDDDDDDDTSPQTIEDVFVQEGRPTDVLFVVDNSCSMQEEQAALAGHFEGYFQHLFAQNIDYHIGITVLDDWATQPPIGQLFGPTPYIDPETPDPVDAFVGNMTMGADGMGSCEVGLEATQRAVTAPMIDGPNAGFYREDARLAVIIVSDEVDGCIYGCDGTCWMPFLSWFTLLKDDNEESIHFTAIVGDEGIGCSSDWGVADSGDGYHEVINELGEEHALWHSICEQDWTPAMDAAGQWAAAVPTTFALGATPILGSLRVFLDLDGAEGPDPEFPIFEDDTYEEAHAFVYDADSNSLVFVQDTAPPGGAQLRVEYEVEGG